MNNVNNVIDLSEYKKYKTKCLNPYEEALRKMTKEDIMRIEELLENAARDE